MPETTATTSTKPVLAAAFSAKKAPLLSPGIWIALAIYAAMVIPNFGYVPLWDSLENLEEYLFLPRQHLYLENLLLMHNGHPSLGYFWPFWISEWLFPSEMLPIHLINLCIGSLAVIAFGKIAALAFEGIARPVEIVLLTIAFAVHPVFVAYAVNISPDYGILAYFLATLWLLYSGRLGWAALTGVLLIFSKEPGVPSYALLLVFYLSGAVRKYRWPETWPLAIPWLVFGLFCAYQKYSHLLIFPWLAHFLPQETFWEMYLPNPFKADFKMACLGPFVFEFQWIFTLVIVAGLVRGLTASPPVRVTRPSFMRWWQGINRPFRCFLFLLAGSLYTESRTVTFTNQRYFFILYPLVLLSFLAALYQLQIREVFRRALLAGAIVLFFFCNFWTLDPVSEKIAGTFQFGTHSLLSIATIRPDFGDLNRDELVYNLQHTYLAYLLDMALAEIRPTNQTTLVFPPAAWWVMSRLDPNTFHRTESTSPPFIKPIISNTEVISTDPGKPDKIFLLLMPNLKDQAAIAEIDPFYRTIRKYVFTKDGYELQVLEMTRRTIPHP